MTLRNYDLNYKLLFWTMYYYSKFYLIFIF